MIRRPPISTLTDTLLPSPQPFRSSILRQLAAAGFLSLDVAGHGGLSVTPPGAGLLQGQGSFRFRRDTVGKASQRARRAAAATELGDAAPALLDALKTLRLDPATPPSVPAPLVFGEPSPAHMSPRAPPPNAPHPP